MKFGAIILPFSFSWFNQGQPIGFILLRYLLSLTIRSRRPDTMISEILQTIQPSQAMCLDSMFLLSRNKHHTPLTSFLKASADPSLPMGSDKNVFIFPRPCNKNPQEKFVSSST